MRAWFAPKEKLFEIVGPLGAKAEAFVDESALPRLRAGSHATFVADTAGMSSVDCLVETIDRVNLSTLDSSYLVSTYGARLRLRNREVGFQPALTACAKYPTKTHVTHLACDIAMDGLACADFEARAGTIFVHTAQLTVGAQSCRMGSC
jgi:hypothetical protein